MNVPRDNLTRRAIEEARSRRPDRLDDIPDEAVERLFITAHIRLGLAVEDLGRAIRKGIADDRRRMARVVSRKR